MRAIPDAELTAYLETGARQFRVMIRHPGEATWNNLSSMLGGDWVLSVNTSSDTPDQPAARFDVRFFKGTAEGSLSPGITTSPMNAGGPMLEPGRHIEIHVRVASYPWRTWMRGEIEDVDWAGDEIEVTCLSSYAAILQTRIETEEQVGADFPGVPMATHFQNMLNRWMADPPTLVTEGDPGAGIPLHAVAHGTSLGEYLRTGAAQIGWDLRYRWHEPSDDYRLTLYLPDRDKTAHDLAVNVEYVFDVAQLKKSRQYVRNAIRVYYRNALGTIQNVLVTDPVSILLYRRQAMILEETADDNPIRSHAQALALANYAKSDLAYPLIDARKRIPFNPFLEIHDVLLFQTDGINFNEDVRYSVAGVSHEISESGAWTEVELRGGTPVGQFYSWHKRASETPPEDETEFDILRLERFNRGDGTILVRPICGARVQEVLVYDRLFELPLDGLEEIGDEENVSAILVPNVDSYVVRVPNPGYWRIVWFVPVAGARIGEMRKLEVGPAKVPTAGLDDLAVTAQKLADAAVEREKILNGAVNDLKIANQAITEAKIALAAVNTAQLADAAVQEAKLAGQAVTTAKLAVAAVTADIIAANAVTETKITNDAVSTPKLQAASVVAGKLAAGSVTTEKIEALAVTAEKIQASAVTAEKIAAGAIVAGKLSAGAIDATNLIANGIITGNLIATETITGTKIVGLSITGDKLAALTITGDKINANSITADKIAVSELAAISAVMGAVNMNSATIVSGTLVFGDTPGKAMRLRSSPANFGAAGTGEIHIDFLNLSSVWTNLFTFSANGNAYAHSGSWL